MPFIWSWPIDGDKVKYGRKVPFSAACYWDSRASMLKVDSLVKNQDKPRLIVQTRCVCLMQRLTLISTERPVAARRRRYT